MRTQETHGIPWRRWGVGISLIVAVALIAGAAFGSGCGGQAAGVTTVTMKGLQYNPPMLTIQRGTTVRWVNQDQTAHTITSDNFVQGKNVPGAWDSGPLNPGQTFDHTFDTTGTFTYSDTVQPYMQGVVVVK